MRDPVAAWAVAVLKHAATARTLRAKLDKRPSPLAARFGLDPLERRILELAHAVERHYDVARLARAAAGGLTVELVRALLGDEVDGALSPRRALRRHALVAVGGVGAFGPAAASEIVRTAPGVSARIDGAGDPEALFVGITRVVANGRGDVPARIATLLRDVDAGTAALVTLDGCPRREAYELAAGLARQRGHGVLVVDGELAATAPDPLLLLACVRREADCQGDALLVCAAAALGERWRALLAPAAGTTPLVVLADAERTRDPVAAAPFTVRRLSLHSPAAPAVAPAADAPRKDRDEPPADDGLEQVRQLAIRDAERALGVYRAPPPPRPAAPAVAVAAPAPAAAAPVAVTPAVAAPPVVAAAPVAATAPASPSGPPRKMSAKALQHFAARLGVDPSTVDVAPAAAVAVAPPAPVAPPPASVLAPPPVAAADLVDGTPLPVASNASPEELARAVSTSPSANQRIELIGRIRLHKTAAVVAALRANAVNPHPGVRAAAEAAMASLFGPNWNTTRPVPKPVQRPPSDDKDRGPPGGY